MKYSKILVFLGIGCVAGLLLVIGVKLQAQNETKEKLIAATEKQMSPQAAQRAEQFRNRQQNWAAQGRQQTSRSDGQQRSDNSSDFYSVIVDNNLFRPLGWKPPNKEPEYIYIGTRTDSNGTVAQAYVVEGRSNQFYVAQIGDKVGDAVVKDIKEKEIILEKKGETITLRDGNIQFLGSGGSRRGGSSFRAEVSNQNESGNNKESSSKSFDKNAKAKAAAEQKAKEEAMRRMQEMRRRFEGASRGDRERMIREFRERGGSRGRRGRDR